MWFLAAALFVVSVAYSWWANRNANAKIKYTGDMEPPRVASGTPIYVWFGTVKIEPIIVAFKVDKIAKYMKATGFLGTQSEFLGWTHTVSYIGLLGWGSVAEWDDLLFDDTKLLSDENLNPRVATLTVDGVGGYYTYTSQSRGSLGNGHQEIYLPDIFGGKPPQGQGQLASGRNDWIGTPHVGGDFFFIPGDYGGGGGGTAYNGLDTYVNAYAGATEPFSFVAQPKYPMYSYMALDWVDLGLQDSLHKIECIVTGGPGMLNTGPDSDPVIVLLNILTNSVWGLGIPEALIDLSSFSNNSFGSYSGPKISGVMAEQKPAEEYIGEILKTIDAALYRAPDTGLLSIQLIRGGYVVSSLQSFDETNVKALEWNRRDIADTTNQVVISFTDREWMFETNTVTLTDHANVFATGTVRSTTLQFPYISNQMDAIQVGARELKERTLPLGAGTLVVDRNKWDAVPGDVLKLSWARYGLTDVPVRVLSVNAGSLEDGLLEIDVSQDVYGLPDVPFVIEETPPSDPTTATKDSGIPTVTERTSQDATTGTLTLLVLDEANRVTAVEFSTQSGNTTASGYSADSSVPYETTVALDPGYPSYIYWRVTYTDAGGNSQTITGMATFTASSGATGSASGQQIVINDGSGGFIDVFDSTAQEVVA